MQNKNQKLGKEGEDIACGYLQKKGYSIVARNWRSKLGEIDIVAKRGGVFVFVEVKTRGGTGYGYPEEAITAEKRQRMERVAELYCLATHTTGMRRLDTIAVILRDAGEPDIKHFENV